MANILSIGPDAKLLAARNRKLRQDGHHVRGADTRATALALAKSECFELILLCHRFQPADTAQLVEELRTHAPQAAILKLAGRTRPLTLSEIQSIIRNRAANTLAA